MKGDKFHYNQSMVQLEADPKPAEKKPVDNTPSNYGPVVLRPAKEPGAPPVWKAYDD